MTGGNHWNDQAGPDPLAKLQDASIKVRDLLRAAEHLIDACATTDSGPLIAVLQSGLAAAEELDDMISDMCDAAADARAVA
jgi:hypothetical protein